MNHADRMRAKFVSNFLAARLCCCWVAMSQTPLENAQRADITSHKCLCDQRIPANLARCNDLLAAFFDTTATYRVATLYRRRVVHLPFEIKYSKFLFTWKVELSLEQRC